MKERCNVYSAGKRCTYDYGHDLEHHFVIEETRTMIAFERCNVWSGGKRCVREQGHYADAYDGGHVFEALPDGRTCEHCGSSMPHWPDVAGALRSLAPAAPVGLRYLMLQAAREIEDNLGPSKSEILDAARYRAIRVEGCFGRLPSLGPIANPVSPAEFDRLIDMWRKKLQL